MVEPSRSIWCSLRLYGVLIIEIRRHSFVVPVSRLVSWFIVSSPASTLNMAIYFPTLYSFLCDHLLLRLLQRLLVAVAAGRHLDQAGEQQRIARHSLDRDLATIFK